MKGGSNVAAWAAHKASTDFKNAIRLAAQKAGLTNAPNVKDDKHKEENLDLPQIVPNRVTLRHKGINVRKGKGQYGRLIRAKMGKPSLETLVAIQQRMPDGRTIKLVIPRENWGGIS